VNVAQAQYVYKSSLNFLNNIINDFEPGDAEFKPEEGAMTVVQQLRHIALTVDWFWQGAFGDGFSEDWEGFVAAVNKPSSLDEARTLVQQTYQKCLDAIGNMTDEQLQEPMAPNNILGEAPRHTVISGTSDHTAHHRGSLAVYLRMTGKEPKMIYS